MINREINNDDYNFIALILPRISAAMTAVVRGDAKAAKEICKSDGNIDLAVEFINNCILQGDSFMTEQDIDINDVYLYGLDGTYYDLDVQFDGRNSDNPYFAKFDITRNDNDDHCILFRDISM